ncbi:unnamed protein product [Paramecium octaurelia]|uniref:AB hydrolase-1 domain-containing protein n=1 Tax=Paramecium octaurelia TaxID=43137 RepID=A0A8S1ULJ4_PAROT|nr:unnamed protein product [Paramecium octaurelia]
MINIIITIAIIYISYRWMKFINHPSVQLFYNNDSLKKVVQSCPSLSNYKPTPYLNGLLHTILATFKHPAEKHTSNREVVHEAGLSVDWIDKGSGIDVQHPLLFIMPGLTGSVDDGYINTIVSQAHLHNFHNICIYNYRMLAKNADFWFKPECYNYGLKMQPNQFMNNYVSDGFYGIDNDYYYFEDDVIEGKRVRIDLVADLHYTLQYLKNKYKFNKILAIGCSYGGVQLGMYLGRFENKALIDAGVTVCSPHIMNITQVFLSTFMNLMLCKILQRGLKAIKEQFANRSNYPSNWTIDVNKALNATWIQDFDTYYTSRVYGYRTADAYYRHFSLINRFPQVQVPMLCISAEDDGVCHLKGLGKEEMIQNGRTILCLAKAGGHIGFLEGWNASSFWFPKPAIEFLTFHS